LRVFFLVEPEVERDERREDKEEGRREELRRVRIYEGGLRNRLRLRKG